MNHNHPPGFTPPPSKRRFEAWRRLEARQRGAIIAATPVAAVAAVASFGHIKELALHTGQPEYVAWGMPISVDGLIIVGSVAMTGKGKKGHRLFGWVVFVVGVLVSLAANLAVAGPSVLDKAVSAWPAVSLLLAVEVLLRTVLDSGQLDIAKSVSEELAKLATIEGPAAVANVLATIAADMPDLANAFAQLATNDATAAATGHDTGQWEPIGRDPVPAAPISAPAGQPIAEVVVAEEPTPAAAEPVEVVAGAEPPRRRRARAAGHGNQQTNRKLAPGLLEQVERHYAENRSLAKKPAAEQDKAIGQLIRKSSRTARGYRTAVLAKLADRNEPDAAGQSEDAELASDDCEPVGQEPLPDVATAA